MQDALLQYQAKADPPRVEAAVVPDLSGAMLPEVVRRPLPPIWTRTPDLGQADPPAVVPDYVSTEATLTLARRRVPPTAFAQNVLPLPAAVPTHVGAMPEGPVGRPAWQPEDREVRGFPPGFPPDWFPPQPDPGRRRAEAPPTGYAAPVDRPVIPFDAAQGVADLPHPPSAPARPAAYAARSAIPPPAGPPSSALLPPGVVSYLPEPQQPPRAPAPRQPQLAPAQNVDPIPQAAPPEGSWYPSADLTPFVRRPRPWLEAFAQNVDPIDTPAYLASFWLSYYPSGPFPPGGLLTALQQHAAEAPPIIEVTVILGAWRPDAPALFRTRPRLTPGEMVGPQDMTTLADAYGCMTLSRVTVTAPTLLNVTVTSPMLRQPTVTYPTLLSAEVC